MIEESASQSGMPNLVLRHISHLYTTTSDDSEVQHLEDAYMWITNGIIMGLAA